MIPLITLALYFVLSGYLLYKATNRSIWGVGYYLLNFFMQPQYWNWGQSLPGGMRWSLISAWLMLGSVYLNGQEAEFREDRNIKWVSIFAILMAINGLVVHFVFAPQPAKSWPVYVEMAKFVILYFVMQKAIQSRQDFILFNWFFLLGLFYWGFEARILGNLTMQQGRLENFGGPGCAKSNELANIVVSLLPIFVGLIAFVKWRDKFIAAGAVLLGINLMMLTQSRGGFVGLIVSGMTIPLVASGRARKRALQGVALGILAFVVLAGNPEIMARFMRTFTSDTSTREAKRDTTSSESRKFFWNVGLTMIEQTPFGSGGDAFDSKRARRIMQSRGALHYNNSVHQGYINEALDWGVQGLIVHLGFVLSGMWCVFKTMRFRKKIGDLPAAFYGPCLLGGFAAWLVGCLVGDFFYLEWGFWLVILAVCYTRIFGQENYGVCADTKVTPEQAEDGDKELLQELAVGRA